jgi:glycosyltransferase involved in cell wall biosynthesis
VTSNKILFILHFPPPVHGSAVIGGFIKESDFINSRYETRYINLSTSFTVDEIGKGWIRKISRYIDILIQVRRQLSLFRPGLCYFTPMSKGIGFYKDFLVIAMVRLYGVKLVYHFHNKGVKTREGRFIDDRLYRLAFRNTDVILLSRLLYPDISKYCPFNRVHICQNGIPASVQPGTSAGGDGVPVILFLSNLLRSKGVFVLLESCKILAERNVAFKCIIAGGDGDLTVAGLESYARQMGLENRVVFPGKCIGAAKEDLFINSDIFVLPTYYFNECMPLVLLEAMKYSLPVVSTFEGAIPELVDDGVTGFLVPQKDPFLLADRIENLIGDKVLREEMGNKGFIKFNGSFTLGKFEEDFCGIIDSLLTDK